MAKKPKIEFKCEKCGKPQPKNESKSNENWNVYDTNAVCECGGVFRMHINDEAIGGGVNA